MTQTSKSEAPPAESAVTPLAEPHLQAVLASAGLDAEYVAAWGNTLLRREADGREHPVVDYAGGYGSLLLGHHHPELTAYARQLLADRVPVHAQFSVHPEADRLARALNRVIGRELGTDEPYFAIFASTGAEAIEAALKHAEMDRVMRLRTLTEDLAAGLAEARAAVGAGRATVPDAVRHRVAAPGALPGGPQELFDRVEAHNAAVATRPPVFLAPEGSFHGKLVGSVQLTHNEGYRLPFRSLAAQARFVPTDQPGALRKIVDEESAVLYGLEVADGEVRLTEHPAPLFGAFVLEPIQGEGGIRELPAAFAAEVREVCAEADCPVVVDEIQSGMGRTGDFLASRRLGLRGDYYTLAKSLGGGLAKISVLLVRGSRYRGEFELVHSSTFAKDAYSSLIALKVLELIEADSGAVYRTAARLGERLLAMLEAIRADYPDVVKDVRGRGLMLGMEFHEQSRAADPAVSQAARAGLFGYLVAGHLLTAHSIRTFPTASAPETLRFEPSVLLTDAEIDQLETALRDVCDIVRGQYRRPLALPAG